MEQINLEVRSDNSRAIALYKKFGFRKLYTFSGFFKINGELVDFDFMNLDLCPIVQDEETYELFKLRHSFLLIGRKARSRYGRFFCQC